MFHHTLNKGIDLGHLYHIPPAPHPPPCHTSMLPSHSPETSGLHAKPPPSQLPEQDLVAAALLLSPTLSQILTLSCTIHSDEYVQ